MLPARSPAAACVQEQLEQGLVACESSASEQTWHLQTRNYSDLGAAFHVTQALPAWERPTVQPGSQAGSGQ